MLRSTVSTHVYAHGPVATTCMPLGELGPVCMRVCVCVCRRADLHPGEMMQLVHCSGTIAQVKAAYAEVSKRAGRATYGGSSSKARRQRRLGRHLREEAGVLPAWQGQRQHACSRQPGRAARDRAVARPRAHSSLPLHDRAPLSSRP